MPLAGNKDHIPGPDLLQPRLDRLTPIDADDGPVLPSRHPFHPLPDLLHNGFGRLAPRIIGGEEDPVSPLGSCLSHQGAFLPVPVATAAEDDRESPRAEFAESPEDPREGIGGVGIIHHHIEGLPCLDRLQPARDVANRGKTLHHSLYGDPERASDTDRREEIVQIVPAEKRGLKLARPPGGSDGRADPLKGIGGSQRGHICLCGEPVRHHPSRHHLLESFPCRVIQVENRGPLLFPEHCEELRLGLEIVLHRPVEVQVILGQVGKDGHVKGAP